ncbi:hypothetical protein BDZ91DRAFT_743126 [Kalaharituber pfeilii]|nr:hypothetical protein BDZ91DRAFT_743126 [Kalaharituber pfeilii]
MMAGYMLNDFPSAMPARRNPDTIFPTPAERRRDQTQAQALNAEQWAENTSLTLPLKQLCHEFIFIGCNVAPATHKGSPP